MSKKLQIKQVTNSGEVLTVISCFAGQLSVFRGATDESVSPYRRALSGTPGPERFVITLDGEDYDPSAHNLVGFGESFLGESVSPAVFLLSAGAPPASIDSVLLAHGLERGAHEPCDRLTRCEERRLRLLAATYSLEKILVTDDPLGPLAMEWRERFAQLLVGYARSANQIVLVTSSSFRPSYWIDNESVARVQVGENVDKTIGFKAGARRATAILNQFRDMLKQDASLGPLLKTIEDTTSGKRPQFVQVERDLASEDEGKARTFTPLTSLGAAPSGGRSRYGRAAFALLMVGALGSAVTLGARLGSNGEPAGPGEERSMLDIARENTQKAERQLAMRDDAAPVTDRTTAPDPEATARIAEEPASSAESQPPGIVKVALALDNYSPDIKSSILATYRGSSAAAPKRIRNALPAPTPPASPADKSETLDLLKSLESASNTGESSKAAATVPDPHNPYTQQIVNAAIEAAPPPELDNYEDADPIAEQQKRELIRQKFLDAIDRAARKAGNDQ